MPAPARDVSAPFLELPPDAADHALLFPEGLVGCPEWRRFVLLTIADEDLPVASLASLDQPGVVLLVADPRMILPGYAVSLSAEDRAGLGLAPGTAPNIYCTLSVVADGLITANLLGPLVVNPATRRGRQLVLAESGYSTRHPVARLAGGGDDACSS
jgi:flagellar assembly factor FliW